MSTEVRGGIVEALVANPVDGIISTGGLTEALVANPVDGIIATGGLVELLVTDGAIVGASDTLIGWDAVKRPGLVGRFAQIRAPKLEE